MLCHGDLHPFNLLQDGDGTITVLDWSAALLAPRTYDLAFTALLLSHPPLSVPRALSPIVSVAGRSLGRSFLRRYQRESELVIDPASLAWHTGLHCLRSLTEVAGWAVAGTLEQHAGHPWATLEPSLRTGLRAASGVDVTAAAATRLAASS